MTKGTWDALGRPAVRPASDPTPEDCLFARVFGSADGLRLLAMLREETVERSGASLDDRALCVLEGRRQVVRDIERRAAAGRQCHVTELRREYPALTARRGTE